MPTPVAVLSGGTRGFELGVFKNGSVAQGFNFPLSSNYRWWNGVEVLATQYLIYTDKYTMGSSNLADTIPVAWATPDLTDQSLINLINTLPPRVGLPSFTSLQPALDWLQGTNDFYLVKNGLENIVTTNLEVYWDAGLYGSYVGTGTQWTDLSGNNRNGTLTNSPVFNSSGVATFNFDGTDDYAITTGPNLTSQATFSCWFKTSSSQSNRYLMAMAKVLSSGNNGIDIYFEPTTIGSYLSTASSFANPQFTTNYYDGQWHMVTVTFDGSNARFYYDGILRVTSALSGSLSLDPIRNLTVGSWANGGVPVNAQIPIAQVYSLALSADQVLQNYNAQKNRFGITSSVESNLVLELDASNPSSYSGSGTEWTDMSGYGNNGTLTNGVSFSTDNGGILVFDGADDYVNLGYKPSLLNFDITQEAWVNADSFTNWHGIISNMSSWGTGFSLQIGNIQNIAAMISGDYLKTSWLPSTGVWYHIVATHRSSDNLNVLYVNGIQENSVIRSISYETNAVTTIGAFYTPNGLLFDGKIGKVKSYNKALTAPEVVQNFETERGQYGVTGITKNGLILWYDAGNYASYNGSGTTWYDISGSVFDGRLLNGPTYSTDGGGSIVFDGADDYVGSIGTTSTFSFIQNTGIYTISAWVKPAVLGTAMFFAGNNSGTAGEKGFYFGKEANNNCWLAVTNGSGIIIDHRVSNFFLNTTDWVYVTCVGNSTTNQFYKNGIAFSNAGSITSLATGTSSQTLALGSINNVLAYNYWWNGSIANFQIYNRALTASEVLQNFNAQKNRYGL